MQNYDIINKVGEGTYGCVYKAINKKTQDVVAMKILNRFLEEEGVSYSALQEIKWLGQLKTVEGVVRLLDSFVHEDKPVLVFNYADCDLTGVCVRGPKLNLADVKCIMKQLLQGLQGIHSRFLMHRDLKAANILLHNGKLMVADLGMMTNYRAHESFSPNCITLWYRAPELLLGKCKYGPEVDMWSVGCIFIELMTRMSPFPGHNEKSQMELIFKAIGTPSEETWGPEVTKLPGWESLKKGQYKFQLRSIFKTWDPEALNLLERFLSPPLTRITAEESLQHAFFTSEPLPQEISRLPKFAAVHEFDVKKRPHPREEPSDQMDTKRQKITSIPATVQPLLNSNLLPGMSAPIPHQPKPALQQPKMVNGHTYPPKPNPHAHPQGSHYAPRPHPYHKPQLNSTGPHQQVLPIQKHVYPNGGYPKQYPNGKYHVNQNLPHNSAPQQINVQKVYIPPQRDTASLHVYHGSAATNSKP